jgi:hypothetical protein
VPGEHVRRAGRDEPPGGPAGERGRTDRDGDDALAAAAGGRDKLAELRRDRVEEDEPRPGGVGAVRRHLDGDAAERVARLDTGPAGALAECGHPRGDR